VNVENSTLTITHGKDDSFEVIRTTRLPPTCMKQLTTIRYDSKGQDVNNIPRFCAFAYGEEGRNITNLSTMVHDNDED